MSKNNNKDTGAGKGDKPRPVKHSEYRKNYDQIDWSKHKNKEKNNEITRTS